MRSWRRTVADRLGRDDLILCSGTAPLAPFRDYVAAASAAGFQGISMWGRDYRRALSEGLTDADLRPFLDEHGLAVGELDGVGQWFPGAAGLAPPVEGEEADSFFGFSEQDLYAIADVVGARSRNPRRARSGSACAADSSPARAPSTSPVWCACSTSRASPRRSAWRSCRKR